MDLDISIPMMSIFGFRTLQLCTDILTKMRIISVLKHDSS